MRWERKGNYHSESDEGYVISATRDGKGGWRFTAWGPVSEEWKKINQYLRSGAGGEPPPPLKVRYAIGETVPQPRESIGVYPDSAQATKACNTHWEKKKVLAAEQLNNKIIEQTRERLKAWGQWLRALDGVGVGLNSSVTGQYDELLEKGHGPDDPEAERMERIMCRLKKQQPPCYKVLKRIYYLGMTIKDTSEDVRVSEATVKVWRGMGESSVAAYWDAGEGLRK